MYDVALDDRVRDAIKAGAAVEFNLSGGADSGAAADAANRALDKMGHARELRRALNADLGRTEWDHTPDQVKRTADYLDVDVTVVSRKAGDLLARWRSRFARSRDLYGDLRLYHMRGPWSSPSLKFCQSEMKAQTMGPHVARVHRGATVIQVTGLRRDESGPRRKTPISKADLRYAKVGNRAGTSVLLWNPIVDWTKEQVFALHEQHDIPLSETYTVWGLSRHSCRFCVMASKGDLTKAAAAPPNGAHLLDLVALEASSAYSFQAAGWLADLADHIAPQALRIDVERAKAWAAERRKIEQSLPARHRYIDGWPLYVPTRDESLQIADARSRILDWYEIDSDYRTASAVRDRFAQLVTEAKLKAA